jgi:hypothetical protein
MKQPDIVAWPYTCSTSHDTLGVNAVVMVEIGNRAGLAKMLNAKRTCAVATH